MTDTFPENAAARVGVGGKVLTVAMPAYNVEAYLERGLTSLDIPELADVLEVIVVDDGSADGTRALAERFAAAQPRIFRVVGQGNRGHGGAVNAGLAAATGRYFRIVDGDDWVDPAGLVRLVGHLRACEADLVVDVRREVDMATGEGTLFPLPAGTPTGAPLPAAAYLREHPEAIPSLTIHALTARTGYLRAQDVCLLEHTFYEDYEFVVKASVPAATLEFLDVEVYQYLVGNAAQSVSHANYVRRWDDHARVVDEMVRYLGAAEAGEVRTADGGPLSADALAYLRHKVELIVDTHYNIALLFDDDRRRGRERARAFRAELRARDEGLWRRGDKRYRVALALNRLGLSYGSIERLVAHRRR